MDNWDIFWKDKGERIEWNKQDVFNSKDLKVMYSKILQNLGKNNLENAELLELGAGMGLTSFYFASKGAKVTLLDRSKDAEILAKNYWGNVNHKFICADLFKIKIKKRYDIVSSFGLCEHFAGRQRKEVLQKHIDFLKNKGVALISVPHKYGIFYRIQKYLAELTGFWSFGTEVPFTKKELIEFASENKAKYDIIMVGFWSSAYDLFVRKPLKVIRINTKRRFDETRSIFDNAFGSGIVFIIKKSS